MIIADIEAIPLRIPFKAGTKSDASAWGDSNLLAADSLLVKVTTDQGLVGWGEAFGFRAVASAKLAVDQLIAPLCIGQDATQIEPLMLAVQKKLHILGGAAPLPLPSRRSTSPFGITREGPPMRRCASFWGAVRPSWTAMRACSRQSPIESDHEVTRALLQNLADNSSISRGNTIGVQRRIDPCRTTIPELTLVFPTVMPVSI